MQKRRANFNLLKIIGIDKAFLPLMKWGVVALGMFAMAVLGAYLSLKISNLGTEVEVPKILSLTQDEAHQLLASEGLLLEITGERIDDSVSQGRILSQDPLSGSKIRKGRKVKAVVSLGSKLLIVPSVLGSSERSAKMKINRQGFNLGWISYTNSNIEKTKVLAQSPVVGVEKLKGGRLNLLISRGERKKVYVMQDFVGREIDSILSHLQAVGLRVGLLKKTVSGYQRGIIVSQYPLPGYPVSEGDVVNLTVLE